MAIIEHQINKINTTVQAVKYGSFTYPEGKTTLNHFQGLFYPSIAGKLIAIMGRKFRDQLTLDHEKVKGG